MATEAATADLGRPLIAGQRAAVEGICTSGERVSLVLGVAGAGNTTALRCVPAAYRSDGYTVVGTATSGQAARTLGREAELGSLGHSPRCAGASATAPSPSATDRSSPGRGGHDR